MWSIPEVRENEGQKTKLVFHLNVSLLVVHLCSDQKLGDVKPPFFSLAGIYSIYLSIPPREGKTRNGYLAFLRCDSRVTP